MAKSGEVVGSSVASSAGADSGANASRSSIPVCERVRREVVQPAHFGQLTLTPTPSMGVCLLAEHQILLCKVEERINLRNVQVEDVSERKAKCERRPER